MKCDLMQNKLHEFYQIAEGARWWHCASTPFCFWKVLVISGSFPRTGRKQMSPSSSRRESGKLQASQPYSDLLVAIEQILMEIVPVIQRMLKSLELSAWINEEEIIWPNWHPFWDDWLGGWGRTVVVNKFKKAFEANWWSLDLSKWTAR